MAKVGRPTEYNFKELDNLIDEYLATCVDEYRTDKFPDGTTKTRLIVNLPSYEGFCIYTDIAVRTFYDWKEKYPEFSHALGRIEARQKKVIMEKGMSGEYNSTIGKLILSSNHGMREKSDVTSDDKPIQSNTIVIKRMDNNE